MPPSPAATDGRGIRWRRLSWAAREYYGTNFVQAGQDTFYLKKFNVQGSNLYKHQYMTNVQAAASEGYEMSTAYSDEMKQTALEFKIPVYTNMPATACTKPALDGSPNNKLGGLAVEGFALTPTFNMDTTSYDLIVDESVSSVNVQASVLDSTASVSGTGTISLQSGMDDSSLIRIHRLQHNISLCMLYLFRQIEGKAFQCFLSSLPIIFRIQHYADVIRAFLIDNQIYQIL